MGNEKNTKLTETEAREAIKDYKMRSGKSQEDISREMGFSSGSALSQFLKGDYAAPHTMISKIEQLLKISEKKEVAPKEPGFKMTSISQQVTDLITYCHVQGKIGVAYGDAGIGKTMAVRQYGKENPDAIIITVSPSYASITGVNELLAEELRIREKVARRIEAETVNKLKGGNRVIIIDEAQHLTVRVINHLRCIADKSFVEGVGGIGIAFVGNEEIYLKMKGAGQPAYAQLFSRIGNRKHLLTSHIKQTDIYDKNKPPYGIVPRKHYDVAFVCVPTEMRPDGSADISAVDEVISVISADVFVIKSAIPVGTVDMLIRQYNKNIVVSPEFYGTTQHSSDSPDFLILGGDKASCDKVAQIFYKVKNGSFRIRYTDTKTAELVKYMENCFLALKVTFCCEFADVAEGFGISYPELRELFIMDERMGASHTFVCKDEPYYDSYCLNKDVPAFIHSANCDLRVQVPLMQAVYAINEDKKKNLG